VSTAELVNHRPGRKWALSVVAILASIVVFIIPFVFMLLTAVKDRQQAADLDFSWPHQFQFVQNFVDVVKARDYMLVIAYINSTILTVASVAGIGSRPGLLGRLIGYGLIAKGDSRLRVRGLLHDDALVLVDRLAQRPDR